MRKNSHNIIAYIVAVALALSCASGLMSVSTGAAGALTGTFVKAAASPSVKAAASPSVKPSTKPSAKPSPALENLGGVRKGDVVSIVSGKVKIRYTVLSLENQTVKLGTNKAKKPAISEDTTDIVKIPSKINCQGYIYKVVEIGNYAFYGCKKVKEIQFPKSSKITKLGNNSFRKCKALNSIVLPNTVKEIGKNAFRGATQLKSFTYVDVTKSKLKTIDKMAFSGLKMTKFIYPASLVSFGEKSFSKCKKLKKIYCKNYSLSALSTIGKSAFASCAALEKFKIPASLKTIETMAFYECTHLSEVTIPKKSAISAIDEAAFYKCSSLLAFNAPESLKKVSKGCFYGCTKLAKVEFEKNSIVNDIGELSFYKCTALKKITIPGTVKKIRKYAFFGDTSLKKVTISDGVELIGDNAFSNCTKLVEIYIPDSVAKIYKTSFEGKNKLLIIYANNGTKAEDYANKHKIDFDSPESVDLEEIKFKSESYKLAIGKTKKINVSFTPDSNVKIAHKRLEWIISKKGVIKIIEKTDDYVKIQGVAAGSCDLVAKSGNEKVCLTTVTVI